MYFLELIPTRNCNQDCSYCEVRKSNQEVELDINYIKFIFKKCFYDVNDMFVEICGGEPGLVKNLDDVYKTLKDISNVKYIQVMSNGLVRMRSFDWLWDVRYVEHLIKDIKGKELVKCYSLPLFKHKLWKYVVVVTEEVARSLLFNWDHHQDLLKRDDIWWKPAKKFIERSFIKQFFLRMEDKNIVNRIITFGKHEEKILCAMNSPYPAIDFETKKLYHCAAYLQECQSVTMNMSNSKKLKECNLFDFDYYCRKCHVFDNDNKAQQILNCRRGNYKNVGKRYLGP